MMLAKEMFSVGFFHHISLKSLRLTRKIQSTLKMALPSGFKVNSFLIRWPLSELLRAHALPKLFVPSVLQIRNIFFYGQQHLIQNSDRWRTFFQNNFLSERIQLVHFTTEANIHKIDQICQKLSTFLPISSTGVCIFSFLSLVFST